MLKVGGGIIDTLTEDLGVEKQNATQFADLVTRQRYQSEGGIFVILNQILFSIVSRDRDRPYSAILFLDNTHIVDKESRNFFRFYLRNSKVLPFFILAGRSEDSECRAIFRDLKHIQLEPLAGGDSKEMLLSLLPESQEEPLISRILELTAGNPLFLEKYAEYVCECGLDSELPPTIQSIFLSNLDRYEAGMGELLKKLSVFAGAFSLDDAVELQAISGGEPEMVPAVLSFFVRQGYIVQQGNEFYFRHDLFRRTLYSALLNHNKRILHGFVADRLAAQPSPKHLQLLYHLLESGRMNEIREEIFKDARHICSLDYVKYVDAILESISPDDPEYLKFLFLKCAIYQNTGQADLADRILGDLVSLCIEQKHSETLARVYHILSSRYLRSNSYDKALICGRRAIHYYREVATDHTSMSNAQLHYANAALYSNNLELNMEIIDSIRTRQHVSPFDNKSVALVERYINTGEYSRAEALLQDKLQRASPQADEMWFIGYHKLCSLYLRSHNFERLRPICLELLKYQFATAQDTSETYSMLAVSQWYTGGDGEVDNALRQAEYFAYQMQDDCNLIETYRLLAVAHYHTRRLQKAVDYAEEGAKVGMKYAAYHHQFGLVTLLSEIYTVMDDPDNARFFLKECDFIVHLDPLLDSQEIIVYWYLKYRYEEKIGYLEKARSCLDDEKRRISDPKLVQRLLSTRIFERVIEEPVTPAVGH
ncbi:MAG: hypothetical protein CMN78_06610 [Spirochaetales bacterium]|nr:hypothetical protein [Spirochaetales bacterium]